MFKFKKGLIKTNRVSNIKDRDSNILNLDRNEKITPPTKKEKKIFNKYLENLNLNLYPNLENTYKRLSKFLKINKKNILITEGVSGGIKNILESIVINRKTDVIIPKPSFALYEIYSKIFGIKFNTFSYDKYFNLDINKIYNLVSKNTAIVFLPFPNIPIEGSLKLKSIEKLINFLNKKKILIAIDEVYHPFNKSTTINLIKKYNNLIVMRSFSKAYGLAGARIGYIVSNKDKIKIFSRTKGGYETNMLSASCIHFILDNIKITKKYTNEIKKGFYHLKKELNNMKINFYGGDNSNFIYINFKSPKIARKIYNKLKSKKIIVRYGYEAPFNNGIILTGCPPKEMKKFIFAFKKII